MNAEADMGRRDVLGWALVLVAGAVVAKPVISLVIQQLSVPGLGEVDTGDPHALLKHGLEDVLTILAAARDLASRDPDWFRRQVPCLDGRWRLLIPLDERHWGLWVLEQLAPNVFVQRTAFITRGKYARAVEQDCYGPSGPAMAA